MLHQLTSSGTFPGCVWFGKKISQIITESEDWLPAAQKSVKGPGWWKGKFLFVCFVLFLILEAGNHGWGWVPVQRPTISGQELL